MYGGDLLRYNALTSTVNMAITQENGAWNIVNTSITADVLVVGDGSHKFKVPRVTIDFLIYTLKMEILVTHYM